MISFTTLEAFADRATHLIDVRAPIEFAKGALPGAVNLPILNDDERQRVGACYKHSGPESAIELGNRLVSGDIRAQRLSAWCEFLAEHPEALLYCFRGGLRSQIAQRWINDAGVPCDIIRGGYKSIRQLFLDRLTLLSQQLPLTVIGGRTGTGKTELLQQLPATIDLEALALHRGSSFGGLLEEQPSNIDFEHAVCLGYLNAQTQGYQRVFVEDEARMVGRVCIPEPVRLAMQTAPLVLVEAPLALRVENILRVYIEELCKLYQQREGVENGFKGFVNHHIAALHKVEKRLGGQNTKHALDLFNAAAHDYRLQADPDVFSDYVSFLLTRYYDPMYDYQIGKKLSRVTYSGSRTDVLNWCLDRETLLA